MTSRRQFLRGAGALLALPFLESLTRTTAFAAAVTKPPLRMGIFTVTGGTVLESWKMPSAGVFDKMPSVLRPLEFAKKDLTLLTGLSQQGNGENVNGHEHCAFTHLTAADKVRREGGKAVASVSVDQFVAARAGRDSLLPSLEFGLAGGENVYSFREDGTSVPFEADPRMVFDRMFRGRKPVVPNWAKRAVNLAAAQNRKSTDSYDRSVLDLINEDARALQKRLGRADQQRLDEYLTAVRGVETRLAAIELRKTLDDLDAASPGPSQPNLPPFGPDGKVRGIWTNTESTRRDPERHGEYIRLMADLMVLAFQTDTTRVCTFAAGSDEAMFPGVVSVGYERHCHTLEHQGNAGRVEDADPIAREACRQMHAWYTSLFAEMVRKMKSIDEGGSTLLDNTMLLYTSYMADGGHGRDEYPALLVGNAQGTIKTGRQIEFQKHTPVANLYVEMIDRMGIKAENFGNSQTAKGAAYGGRLPGLV
jgi:hypothetical protein